MLVYLIYSYFILKWWWLFATKVNSFSRRRKSNIWNNHLSKYWAGLRRNCTVLSVKMKRQFPYSINDCCVVCMIFLKIKDKFPNVCHLTCNVPWVYIRNNTVLHRFISYWYRLVISTAQWYARGWITQRSRCIIKLFNICYFIIFKTFYDAYRPIIYIWHRYTEKFRRLKFRHTWDWKRISYT